MNEQLIKFIELCLMDGVVSDKEREVIFRKSKELGVPEDECEIILEGMIQQKGGEVKSKEVSVQTNIPVSNSFEEKKPDLIKRKTLNKQPDLESSNSKNDSKYIEIEKQKKELEEQLNQCLSLEIVKKRKTLNKLITLKSYVELQKTVETVRNNIILTGEEHKKVKPTRMDFISLKGFRKENKKYIDRILLFLKKERPDYLFQNTSIEQRISIGMDPG